MDIPVHVLDVLKTPVLLFQTDGKFLYANVSAASLLPGGPEDWRWPDIANSLPADYVHQLHEVSIEGSRYMVIECTSLEPTALQNELFRLEQQNQELEAIIEASSDELFVTDGEGRVLLVSGDVAGLYDIDRDQLIGRSVFDLEKERVFYPSVISLVLRDGQRHTILQSTRHGRQLAVTGNPVFDQEGRLIRVISSAIDVRDLPAGIHGNRPDPAAKGAVPTSAPGTEPELVASSPIMQILIADAQRIAATRATVLLLGETGVGKNRLARYIHERSNDGRGPFVEVNCAALPGSLIESELFGYERGAFTGSNREGKIGKVETAQGGTLFLNEIGELPLHVQAKLLDFVQTRQFTRVGGLRTLTVDARIISATNRDLAAMVDAGTFREDLYYRLNVVPVEIPPLRDRREDMDALTESILTVLAQRHQTPPRRLHPGALALLKGHSWPGNIRELENVLERLFIRANGDTILPTDVMAAIPAAGTPAQAASDQASGTPAQTLKQAIEAFEYKVFAQALERHQTTYDIAHALGISQPTVVRRLKYYGLSAR